jgi:hypothetical protein
LDVLASRLTFHFIFYASIPHPSHRTRKLLVSQRARGHGMQVEEVEASKEAVKRGWDKKGSEREHEPADIAGEEE